MEKNNTSQTKRKPFKLYNSKNFANLRTRHKSICILKVSMQKLMFSLNKISTTLLPARTDSSSESS